MGGSYITLASVRLTGGRRAEFEVVGAIAIEGAGSMLEGNGPIAVEVMPAALRVACPAHVTATPLDARIPPHHTPAAP
jgi:hypothetical protein